MFWTRLFAKAGLGRVFGGFGKDLEWILQVADYIVDSSLLNAGINSG